MFTYQGIVRLQFKSISINDLIINPNNDRHGPTLSEESAIDWLFANKATEMRNLAKRIAKSKRVFDSPLVLKHGNKFIVKDGNRRTTCVKLIHQPSKAPEKFRTFFEVLNSQCSEELSLNLVCQIEQDEEVADEIIGLRHNGTQNGAGQVNWGTREKANHANRIKVKSDYSWAQKVENFLVSEGYPKQASSIKRSTLDKILDTKARRKRVGLSEYEDGRLKSENTKENTLRFLLKLVDDMLSGDLTLKDLLTSEDKNNYLDVLASQGYLPNETSELPESDDNSSNDQNSDDTGTSSEESGASENSESEASENENDDDSSTGSGKAPKSRDTLIPRKINYHFHWHSGQSKLKLSWEQLQYHLNFKKHKISIAVMMRLLLELAAKGYLGKSHISSKGTLPKDLKEVAKSLFNFKEIDKKTFDDICRVLDDKQAVISVENLQRVLHSQSQIPASDDLMSMWDCLEP
ncbi:hypothetical protein [Amylibacter sp. IMCC11727]|uniref:hypothetical protein n=1 Tax=Amylibacter sp. IMCC11727 TaxID=3039851 RepID=UPI00244E33AB|nr:hypothetical protein [Amylibacter sp. IMCC11727]WGI23615.1 hypothetical protein QBD29_05505 [Amylibacter sp. IMCC11727]